MKFDLLSALLLALVAPLASGSDRMVSVATSDTLNKDQSLTINASLHNNVPFPTTLITAHIHFPAQHIAGNAVLQRNGRIGQCPGHVR
jgi:hypothetical protein